LGGDDSGQIGSVCCQMMKKKVRRNLPEAKLPSCYDWLMDFIS
jgi:hypothetical protein